MSFCPSFMRATYSSRLVSLSSDLEVWKRISLARRPRLVAAGWIQHLGEQVSGWTKSCGPHT